MIDVVALGELLIDFTCTEKDSDGYPTMKAHPGGAPANFLAALTKYGAKTANNKTMVFLNMSMILGCKVSQKS